MFVPLSVKLCSALGPSISVHCIILLLTERLKAMNFEYWDPSCYNAMHSCVIIKQFKTKCKSNVVKIWYIPAPPCVRWKLNWLHLYFSYFLQGHICISPHQLIRISRPGCNAQGCKYLDFFSRLSTLALQHLNYLLSYSYDCHEQHLRVS